MKPDYPQDLNLNVYLMCAPFVSSFNNEVKNNALMKDDVKINYEKAFCEWLLLYRFIAERGLVYVLPNEGWHQDLIYVANLGLVLHHLPEPTVILSNFTSAPRQGEEQVGKTFFSQMKYNFYMSKFKFEGEADCKYIRNNLYIAGYGIRSDIRTYKWLQDEFGCKIIPILMDDPKLYHWDCCFYPFDEENAIVNTSVLSDDDVKLLSKYINVISVPREFRYTGITNLGRVDSIIMCREMEAAPQKWLTNTLSKYGLEVKYFPLNSQNANGADLSCAILHLNKPFLQKGNSVVSGVRNFLHSS